MTMEELRGTLEGGEPPAGMAPLIEAMWWQTRGDWQRAHLIAQDVPTSEGAWVHAYLHRCEGDLGNAGYWYRQAGQPARHGSLQEEWEAIMTELLRAVAR